MPVFWHCDLAYSEAPVIIAGDCTRFHNRTSQVITDSL